MAVFSALRKHTHEQVVFLHDAETSLRAIVAIHDTTLGPGLGGVRVRDYASESEALRDVLLLSEAMTYKAAVAGLRLGGGKAVVLGHPKDRRAAFLALGRGLKRLGGRYIPTEDMGVTPADIETIRETGTLAVGSDPAQGGAGDPSPVTAYGVFRGMHAALVAHGRLPDLAGKRVVVQGVGKVGLALVELLVEAGAEVQASDVDPRRIAMAKAAGARIVPNDTAHTRQCDIYSPCAAGGAIHPKTIGALRCEIVAGGANNQLSEPSMGRRLKARGILYAPDFVINAGGLISVADELNRRGYDRGRVMKKAAAIESTLAEIFAAAERRLITPGDAAIERAAARIAEGADKAQGGRSPDNRKVAAQRKLAVKKAARRPRT